MSILYDIISILPLSLLTALIFGGCAGFPDDSVSANLLCPAVCLCIILVRSMKRKARDLLIGASAVFFIVLLLAAGEENRIRFLQENFWVLWAVLFSCAAFAAGILMERSIWAKRTVTTALVAYCAAAAVLGTEVSGEAVAVICFILLVHIAGEVQRKWEKSGSTSIRDHITMISPVFLAVCLFVHSLPAPDEPYDWKLAKDIWSGTVYAVSGIYGYLAHPAEEYGSIGFSDSGGFLAGLSASDEEVLLLSVGNTTIKDLRLVGCMSGDFTGREWVFDTGSETFTRMTDTLETLCAVEKYAGDRRYDYLQKTEMYCKNLFYNTRYIFAPDKTRVEDARDRDPGISEKNGSIISGQRLDRNGTFVLSCYVINHAAPDLAELLESAPPITEEEWERTSKSENVYGRKGYSYEDYLGYRAGVYEKYCRSYGLTGEAARVTDAIKNSSSGRYGKLKALEAYLKKLEYSTDCGPLPGTVSDADSFLDYFLGDSRKGYCMHFATAFVLMANEMGIPCRYVQGYNVRRSVKGDIVVTQNCAHAWPEAYFDNAGWVAFEPTPGYAASVGWGTRADPAVSPLTGDTEPLPELQPESEDIPEEPGSDLQGAPEPIFFIVPAASALCFLILFLVISRAVSRRRYSRMSRPDRFRYIALRNIRLLGMLGYPMEENETLAEYSGRLSRADSSDTADCLGFIPVFETVLYSDREITDEDVISAEKTHDKLLRLVKKSRLRNRLLFRVQRN